MQIAIQERSEPQSVPVVSRPTVAFIFAQTAKYYNVSEMEMIDHLRTVYIVRVRHIATYLASKITGLSNARLADLVDRERTTLVNSNHNVKEWRKRDPDLRAGLKTLEAKIWTAWENR